MKIQARQAQPLLFLAPTGLAVGLALKECATPELRRFAPRSLIGSIGFPASRRRGGGNSAGLLCRRGTLHDPHDKCHMTRIGLSGQTPLTRPKSCRGRLERRLRARLALALGPLAEALNDGHVYVILGRLEKSGLLSSRRVGQTDRPDRRVFELTPAGHDRVKDWLEDTTLAEARAGGVPPRARGRCRGGAGRPGCARPPSAARAAGRARSGAARGVGRA